jgi:hypothetical protein
MSSVTAFSHRLIPSLCTYVASSDIDFLLSKMINNRFTLSVEIVHPARDQIQTGECTSA